MRIAFLSFYSGHIDRGVEIATEALAKRLNRHYEVTVFQAGSKSIPEIETVQLLIENDWTSDSSENWSRLFYLDYYSRKILQFTFKFLPFFFRFKYDIIIATSGGWQVAIVRLATWILGRKMLVQGNAGIGRDDYWQLLWWPDCFIAISPNGFNWARQKAPWVKIVYIPYGVDIKLFKKVKPAKVSLKKPIVLCVAAFSPYKRIDLLIRAIAQLTHVSLLVIGQGPLQKYLQRLGHELLGNRFLLLTGINHQQLVSYYKACQLFSLPSKSTEALGIVYLEAMAAGLPVVAPDDWRREIIGEAGLYVNPKDYQRYAQTVNQALNSKFGQKPLKQAQKYDWEIIIEQYQKFLDTLE